MADHALRAEVGVSHHCVVLLLVLFSFQLICFLTMQRLVVSWPRVVLLHPLLTKCHCLSERMH